MKFRLALVVALLLIAVSVPAEVVADDGQTPVWQSADDIRSALLDAQRELFAAARADDPSAHYQAAGAQIDAAEALYIRDLQPTLQQYAAEQSVEISTAFNAVGEAAQTGDAVRLALERGSLWSALLHASYATTLSALNDGDFETASAWLSFREYRQATRVTIILSPAAHALAEWQKGQLSLAEASAIVENDLRDTYYFRLRQAAMELETALNAGYFIRAAEWLGQVQGYFALFADDYRAQTGSDEPTAYLGVMEAAVLTGDADAAGVGLERFRVTLTNYQPVALTNAQIAERGQLLYIFTDLVYIEYKDGVRDGQITIPIEYQEANTFLGQARTTFDELRPVIAAADAEAVVRLDAILAELQTLLDALGDTRIVRELVDEGKRIISATLSLDMNNSTAATFTIVNTLLADVEASIADGRYQDAENTRLQAYALFDFGPEQRLLAFSPDLAFEIDALFWHGDGERSGLARVIAAHQSVEEFRLVRGHLTTALDEAQIILGTSSQPLTIIVNSAIIVFREGLEAVVIIAALSAGIIRQNTHYRRPLFVGAFGAFLAAGLTWVIADAFLALFRDYGERLEAVVSLLALGVLLLITNWFFHKVYWTDHLAGFHQRKGQLLRGESGKIIGLLLLGFTSIYREGFETVLFLQALVLDAGVGIVLQGVFLGLVGVSIVGVITFRMQTRLPYMSMMVVTGVLIGVVLVMLVGSTVRVMQVVAWLPVHPIDGLHLPHWLGQWFGVYPTWEGLLAQGGAAAFVIGSYYLAEYRSARARSRKANPLDLAVG